MKRPIDPNLSTNSDNDFLPGLDTGRKEDFSFNDYRTKEKEMLDEIRVRNGNLEVICSRAKTCETEQL